MLSEYRIIETARLAIADIKETYPEVAHMLNGLPIECDRATKRLGATHYRGNNATRITLSKYHTDPAIVDNTTRHEVAHVLAGYNAHHGPEWQRWARKCGTSDSRCSVGNLAIPKKAGYTVQCPTEGCPTKKTYQKDCKSLRYFRYGGEGSCRKCGYRGLFRIV